MIDASADATRTVAALTTILGSDLRPLLKAVTAPIGAIWGAQDRTVPARTARVLRNYSDWLARTDGRASLQLADGRRLTYSVTGPADGVPVVYCHGAIGTPLGRSVNLETITSELGLRHVAVSRPGIGGSDAARGRRVVDLAADVDELADALGIDRFAVVGVSAGGPYALALAHAAPSERGFGLGGIDAEVHLWHGLRDLLVPIEHALQLSVLLPRCRVFFDPDEGHHFFRRRLAKILGLVVDRDPTPAPAW